MKANTFFTLQAGRESVNEGGVGCEQAVIPVVNRKLNGETKAKRGRTGLRAEGAKDWATKFRTLSLSEATRETVASTLADLVDLFAPLLRRLARGGGDKGRGRLKSLDGAQKVFVATAGRKRKNNNRSYGDKDS